MQHIEFTCKVISPLILNGASGNDPELRPPAIKASMRYWWRAIHGHLCIKNLDDLRNKEDKIFGSTKNRSDSGWNKRKSCNYCAKDGESLESWR